MAEIQVNLPEVSLPKGSLEFFQRILGPLAEAGDFLSEKIRFYRWQSSLRTIERAKAICEEHGVSVREIPLKTLIPLIEKSSIEEPQSPLTDRWAMLLASAASDPKSIHPLYAEVLASLQNTDVILLDKIVEAGQFADCFDDEDETNTARSINVSASARVASEIHHFTKFLEDFLESDYFDDDSHRPNWGTLPDKLIIYRGTVIEQVEVYDLRRDTTTVWLHTRAIENLYSVDVLIQNGLLTRHTENGVHSGCRFKFSILAPTVFGVRFVAACRGECIKGAK